MLPRKIYEELASLKSDKKDLKLTVSLYFFITENGMVCYESESDEPSLVYQESVLQNQAQLSYQEADKLLND